MTELGDLLAAAGYSSGDVLVIGSFGPPQTRSESTTSTSYSLTATLGTVNIQWDRIRPSSGSLVVAQSCEISPGTGETASIKWRNVEDGEDLGIELSISSFDFVTSSWVQFTPTTTADTISLRTSIKTSSGTNSSAFRNPNLYIGVQL